VEIRSLGLLHLPPLNFTSFLDKNLPPNGIQGKVETPIHDSIRELVTWECKEHGVNIMNVLANPKGSVGRWNLNF
jgi:hypothetical protein